MFDFLLTEASAKELFAFNLLPPKSKEDIAEEMKKKRATLYGLMIPAFVIVLGLLLFVGNELLLERNKASWSKAVATYKQELANPNTPLGQLKVVNGELKIKTDFIAEPVTKNVNFSKIFEIRDKVFNGNTTGSQPTSYARESDGRFLLNSVSTNPKGPQEIYDRFRKQELVDPDSVEIRQVIKVENSNEFRFTILFRILNEQVEL